MKKSVIKTLLAGAVLTCAAPCLRAQVWESSDWYFGVGEGFHTGGMNFSELDNDAYGSKKNLGSGVISIFVQGEFGSEHQFGVRPELAYLKRGGRLTGFDLGNGVEGDYRLKSHYVDIRVALIYNFCKSESAFRPYVFVTPMLGFSGGGRVSMEAQEDYGVYAGVKSDLSNASISSTYFALAPGVGVRYHFNVNQRHRCFVGVEASYEFGLTDTYGKREKDGEAIDMLGNTLYQINGSRKFSGFEIKAVLGIPFSVFRRSEPAPVAVVEEPVPVVAKPAPVPAVKIEKEKPCYTLDEIIGLMAANCDVTGKTICAIDDINFDFGKSTIKPQSHVYLDKLAAMLIRTNANIKINGHTDNVGSDEFNMNLSKERALAVMNYLIGKGVSPQKLSYGYYGATEPLTDNDTEEGRKLNRRVEFEIQK